MHVNWLIVGAGITGCTLAERIASQLGQKVLVVERRDHIGGNAYDEYDAAGVLVHRYGPHVFHTSNRAVWDYLSQFTRWRPYQHRVLAVVDGKKVPVPFNLNSLYALFPARYAGKLEDTLISNYGFSASVPILELKEAGDMDLQVLAEYIYQRVFYGYTLKQWGLKPEELDPLVTGRVPVRVGRDDRYFQDAYQGIPMEGYTTMFRRMLKHPNIHVLLNADYKEIVEDVKFDRMIYTGSLDAFFDYAYGPLPYRSLWFDFVSFNEEWYQEVGTVNYPNEYDFTRITEYKHLAGQRVPWTALAYEYPEEYVPDRNEPYYPVPRQENYDRYLSYLKEARKLGNTVLFAGRLADYKYYNMDQAVAQALQLFEEVAG
ncbi:MAG: UDP-galactopyranose mutase [Clostridia bacterium]|nr:MAG: UDP-galactopyranose mutase [Clostridia bacterium]